MKDSAMKPLLERIQEAITAMATFPAFAYDTAEQGKASSILSLANFLRAWFEFDEELSSQLRILERLAAIDDLEVKISHVNKELSGIVRHFTDDRLQGPDLERRFVAAVRYVEHLRQEQREIFAREKLSQSDLASAKAAVAAYLGRCYKALAETHEPQENL